MKDRVSTYPGRVKLQPVEGQANTYDMTRADVPVEPGTPLNQQTLLQPSTAQYLKLPYADPTVDDALRHMVDRVVPIGTIRTSPAQSLGDAWLKCDGSMVTFENYPQLCSVLRNTGGAVTWSSASYPSTLSIDKVSNAVYFDGKWIICVKSGSNYKLLSAETIGGTWTEEATFSAPSTTYAGMMCELSASENYCVCLYYTESKPRVAARSAGSPNWTQINMTLPKIGSRGADTVGIDKCAGTFGFAFEEYGSSSTLEHRNVYFVYSDTPMDADSWAYKLITYSSNGYNNVTALAFSAANDQWLLAAFTAGNNSSETGEIRVYGADNVGKNFSEKSAPIKSVYPDRIAVSKVVFMSGSYYFLFNAASYYDGSGNYTGQSAKLYKSANLTKWTRSNISGDFSDTSKPTAWVAASESMLVFATQKELWTTSSPDDGLNKASTPDVYIEGVSVRGMVATASSTDALLYHDYTYDSRLLPTISLSDDTTTFIKAKNELDVFEAQAGGD